MGVLPRAESDIHEKIRNLNALNQFAYGSASDVWFLNLEDSFASGLGQIYPQLFSDGVHLTTEGYIAWATGMNPLFFELLGEDPAPPQGDLGNQLSCSEIIINCDNVSLIIDYCRIL